MDDVTGVAYKGFDKPIGVVLHGLPYALVPLPDGRPGFRAYKLNKAITHEGATDGVE